MKMPIFVAKIGLGIEIWRGPKIKSLHTLPSVFALSGRAGSALDCLDIAPVASRTSIRARLTARAKLRVIRGIDGAAIPHREGESASEASVKPSFRGRGWIVTVTLQSEL
jgi:hypothetical protein